MAMQFLNRPDISISIVELSFIPHSSDVQKSNHDPKRLRPIPASLAR
jgi:hypothetical protein